MPEPSRRAAQERWTRSQTEDPGLTRAGDAAGAASFPRRNRLADPPGLHSPAMATAISEQQVGPLLRQWRERRRVSQLELALEAGVSARHVSFVETGRSKPGRDMLLQVLGQLDVPPREQNRLLLAAGHAPAFPERPLGGPALPPVREALDTILR